MKTKQDVMEWIDENSSLFTRISDEIWAHPEIAFQEFMASDLHADFLESDGFRIARDIGDLNTAIVAEWGEGKPIIGFIGEYDALSGLSQKNQSIQEPMVEGSPGHGCGHNLLGTGCLAAASAVKQWLNATGREGTVRYYGCPAEERLTGKTFMARSGVFDDLDAAFNYHPGRTNRTSKGSAVGLYDLTFRFHGIAAHAGGNPDLGRSALDAVELMNVGVNYLREHVTSNVRIHYVITHGGDVPNIVPPEAEVWYFIRAHQRDELDDVLRRIRKIAQGAALMTETTMDEVFNGACSSFLNNHYLADLQNQAMLTIGPPRFTDDEKSYAREINESYPEETKEKLLKMLELPPDVENRVRDEPLYEEVFPTVDESKINTGSTDVGDVSWITPLSMFSTTSFAAAAPGHNWGIAATCGMSIGHKGMIYAAKIMAFSAMDLLSDPEHLRRAREEFEKATKNRPYKTPLPDELKPPHYERPK
jgi:aminobenzoyl-glutamate utilization protein B